MKMKHKNLKKALAIGCALASLTQLPALGSFAVTLNEVETGWNALIQREKDKFPEKVNGQQCYWNGGNVDSYTTTPCTSRHMGDNYLEGPSMNFYDVDYDYISQVGQNDMTHQNESVTYSQCYGFALKVSMDLFGNDTFCQYNLDGSGNVIYSDGTRKPYEPKLGDVVRIKLGDNRNPHHSIILTGVNSYGVYSFAQCNANGQCEIDWDQTQVVYQGSDGKGRTMNVTADVLRRYLANGGWVERHCVAGDLNLDGTIDSKDVTKFNQLVATGKLNETPDEAADVNHDNMINEQDLAKLRSFTADQLRNQHYVNTDDHPDSRYNRVVADFFVNGAGYDVTSDGNATFVGVVDKQKTSFTVPSRVYDNVNKKYRYVTQIGDENPRYPGGCRVENLTTVTLPYSVEKINRFAFMNSKLQTLNFSSNSSNLTTVEENAFAFCKLTNIEWEYMTDLTTIGNNAFAGITTLGAVSLPYSVTTIGSRAFQNCTAMTAFRICSSAGSTSPTGYCELTNIGDQAFNGCTMLRSISLPYADEITFGNGVLTNMAASIHYPVRIFPATYTAASPLIREIILDDADIAELRAGRIYFSYIEGKCLLKDTSGRILKSNGYLK